MIVRIMGEGQMQVDDSHLPGLNKLDDDLLAAIESGDHDGFRRTLGALLDAVRSTTSPGWPRTTSRPSWTGSPAARTSSWSCSG